MTPEGVEACACVGVTLSETVALVMTGAVMTWVGMLVGWRISQ